MSNTKLYNIRYINEDRNISIGMFFPESKTLTNIKKEFKKFVALINDMYDVLNITESTATKFSANIKKKNILLEIYKDNSNEKSK